MFFLWAHTFRKGLVAECGLPLLLELFDVTDESGVAIHFELFIFLDLL